MLGLLLFNLGGYALLFQYLIYQSDNSLNNQINHNRYKAGDLVEIKIPAHLTQQDWNEYEVVAGQVKLKDTTYVFAELKLTRDTMFLKCIPNHEKGRLVNAKNGYAMQVSDIPLNKKHIPLIKKSIAETEYTYTINKFHALVQAEEKNFWNNYDFLNTNNISINYLGEPPEANNYSS